MKRFAIIMMMCVGCITAANAQSSFTQQLQKSNAGEGKITVTQDRAINDLVNGQKEQPVKQSKAVPVKQAEKVGNTPATNQEKEKNTEKLITPESQTTIALPDTTDTKKVMKNGHKIAGYRVQVFAGGNSRNDRVKAERTGSEIKALFPGEAVYVHFYSPRWICRMGNYRTYEEAHEILTRVKSLGYDSAIIVKGKITVQYP